MTNKIENPFATIEYTCQNLSVKVSEIIEKIYELNHIIESHNKKNKEFEEITKAAKRKLEGHYINVQLQELSYFQKEEQYGENKTKIAKAKEIIDEKVRKTEFLEAELSNEALGAEEFNLKLKKFLGYGDIQLEFDKVQKGYKIVRNGIEEAKNLSEGEKTSIAFLYFITKLHENGNNIEDATLIIDDPISSFDSNKIFHAYAFLKSECKNAKQLFVLTHNYSYYSLMLGWFNKETIKIGDKKQPNYALYKIEVDILDGKRNGFIRSAGTGLTQSSEYDYVFYNVYKFKDKVLNKEELIYAGNLARKLVESFLSFKFPAQRGDLKALLDKAFPGKEDEIDREEIYRFINVYSHHKFIDVTEQLDMDILDACLENVIEKVLDMIKRLDEEHYIAMIKRAVEECYLN
jgi:wobble nucleotide-excising tRNase